MRHVIFGLLALVLQCDLAKAVAASFDCAKASKHAERIVCASAQLSDADTALGQAYGFAMSSVDSPEEVRSEQRRWIREVRDQCIDEACLAEAYRSRIETLNKARVPLKVTHPRPSESAKGATPEVERTSVPGEAPIEPIKVLSVSPNEFQLEVTGSGPTAQDARTDGIRQALQRTVPQIIATERVVQNDSLVMDSIMSSMNGHVQSVDVLSTVRSGNNYEVRMRVHVSRRDIVNFVSLRAHSGTSFQGTALLAELQRETEARRFRDTFIERSLQGYPAAVITAKMVSLIPDSDSSLLKFRIEYRLKSAFVEALRNAANEVKCVRAESFCSQYKICTQIGGKDIVCTLLGAGAHQQAHSGYYQSLVDTFGLPREKDARGKLNFAMRFLDSKGTRVGRRDCYDTVMYSEFDLVKPGRILEIRPRGGGKIDYIYFFSDEPLIYEDKFPLAKLGEIVDLSRTQSVVLAPVIVGKLESGSKEVVFDVVRQPRQNPSKSDSAPPTEKGCLWPE